MTTATEGAVSLYALTEEALSAMPHDHDEVELVVFAQLSRTMRTDLIHRAIREQIRRCQDYKRRAIIHSSGGQRSTTAAFHDSKAGLTALAARRAATWFDFPLRNGTLLGDAYNGDLASPAEHAVKSGMTLLATGLWLNLIRKRLPDGICVRDHFTEQQLAALREDAARRD